MLYNNITQASHRLQQYTLKIQYLADILLSNFSSYKACRRDFNAVGIAFINASTSSLIFSFDSSNSAVSIVLNI